MPFRVVRAIGLNLRDRWGEICGAINCTHVVCNRYRFLCSAADSSRLAIAMADPSGA
jgi:hypothetical protein